MPGIPPPKHSDIFAYAFAVGLAMGCLGFASYKVVTLRAMENPPADLGLNFPAPKRKMITDDSVLVDPATTNSVTPIAGDASPPPRPLQPYTAEVPVESYKLLAVIDGVAFVEVKTFRGTDIVPVAEGARLPGAGRVQLLTRNGGRWMLIAGHVKLESERP